MRGASALRHASQGQSLIAETHDGSKSSIASDRLRRTRASAKPKLSWMNSWVTAPLALHHTRGQGQLGGVL